MADAPRVELRATSTDAGVVVARAVGPVVGSTLVDLRDGLAKLLADGVPVLLDVSEVRLDWAPAPEVFVSAVTAAGGWPLARLVLFGADRAAAERLRSCRVTDAVPLALTAEEAAVLADTRPARLARGVDLPARAASIAHAREFLRDTCVRWGLPDRDDVAEVVTELVRNAVVHAGTGLRLRLVLDRTGIRVSVRDRRPGVVTAGDGLRAVARRSRTWGVLHYADGKSVWAHLPNEPIVARPPARPVRAQRPPASITMPRRQQFATGDPEQAHAFLRTVYGPHTLHLADPDLAGFHLEYDGVATNRFAVEHIRHATAVECLFAPAESLVVVHPLAGDLHVASGRHELRTGPGDVLLCDAATDLRISSPRLDVEVVRLDPAAVARVVGELTGFDAPTLPVGLCRAVSPGRAAHWRATVAHLRRDVLVDDEVMAGPLTRTALFRYLVAMLVESFPNPAVARTQGEADRLVPPTLRRAMRYIEDHAADDIALADIAAAAGLGARGLQLSFRRHHDVTPLEYLRRVRLDRAHRDLRASTPSEATVGGIADRWGFPHHGNFSALYLRTYGCSPSMTLRS
jgi:AraC-like DNA-binding protein